VRRTARIGFINSIIILLLLSLALLPAGTTQAQTAGGCPPGSAPGGPDFVFNGDFAIGAGPGPGVDPAAGFTSDVPNAGDGNYPPDTFIAIQTGSISFFGGQAQQDPFPGDPAYGIPGVNTFLYVNGNNTGAPYVFWRQTITGLSENTTYNLFAYVNNIVIPTMPAPIDPIPEFLINNVPTNIAQPIPEEPDIWIRYEITYTTGPGETSFEMAIRDAAIGIQGDDLAVTYIGLQECLPVQNAPAISVVKTVTPTVANVGDTVTYTYVVTNTGNVELTGVTLNDDRLGAITLPGGTLGVGQSFTVNVNYTIQDGDLPLTNIATTSGTPPTGPAVTDTDSATVNPGVGTPQPAIGVNKSVSPNRASVGDTVTYTYVVTNTGNVTLTNVTLNDDRLGAISLPVTTLNPGQSTTVTVTYTIQPGDLPLTNVATVAGTPPTGGSVSASDRATVRPPGDPAPPDPPAPPGQPAAFVAPALQIVDPFITKSVNPPFAVPGEQVTWTITISNPGSIPVTNVQMQDTMPAEVAIHSVSASAGSVSFSGQTVSFSIDSLAPGASVTITVNTRVRDNAALPFILTNNACTTSNENPQARCAQATLVSAGTLPATGISPWSAWRMPIFAAVFGLLLAGGWLIRRRWRR
jgi:uncharacterized repeat protein (TIGR01451 family)